MKRPIFIENEIYHIYNRGVDKRDIFMEDGDFVRFIHSLFYFNDQNSILNFGRDLTMNDIESHSLKKGRKLLVEILAFALMPNHYHLIIRQRVNDGVVKFMQKLGIAYAKFFNEKYKRSGHLFEGRFKAELIKRDAHFLYLPYYIHLNPLDIAFPGWKKKGIKDYKKAIEFLENYRWSSYLDYIGKKNFSSVTQREFLLESFGGRGAHRREINNWIKNKSHEKLTQLSTFDFK